MGNHVRVLVIVEEIVDYTVVVIILVDVLIISKRIIRPNKQIIFLI